MRKRIETYRGEKDQEGNRTVLKKILGHVRSSQKGFFLFCGKHYRGPVVAAAIYPALEGNPVAVVDGGNMFDPYVISRVARMLGVPPGNVLSRFFISRGFTCYQVENLIVSKLPDLMKQKRPGVLIVTGLLETFYDSDVPVKKATSLLRSSVRALLGFSRKMPVMGVTPLPPLAAGERGRFFDTLLTKADTVYTPEGVVLPSPCNYPGRSRDL